MTGSKTDTQSSNRSSDGELGANVIDLDSARWQQRAEGRERRGDVRRPSQDRLFVQVVGDDDDAGTTLASQLVNTSRTGIQCTAAQRLPAGTPVDLWIDIPYRSGKFFLSGRVSRCVATTGGFGLGIELLMSKASDLEEWYTFHSHVASR